MKYNLTDQQKELARVIVNEVRQKLLPESFDVRGATDNRLWIPGRKVQQQKGRLVITGDQQFIEGQLGTLDALGNANLLLVRETESEARSCTVTGLIFRAVDCNFAEDEEVTPVSTLAAPHPPEIAMSLDRLRSKYPDPKKLGFLIMRFTAAKPFASIVRNVQETGAKHGLFIVRADEHQFHDDLWSNVRTYMHGCGFGIAVYERIETDEPNANVGLEVGYLMAMNKPVLLLKDKTLETLQADLAGKLYKPFDPHDPEGTIPTLMEKWLRDFGIVVPGAGSGQSPPVGQA